MANNLKRKYKEAKLTQKELSIKAGISFGSLKRFEMGGSSNLKY